MRHNSNIIMIYFLVTFGSGYMESEVWKVRTPKNVGVTKQCDITKWHIEKHLIGRHCYVIVVRGCDHTPVEHHTYIV